MPSWALPDTRASCPGKDCVVVSDLTVTVDYNTAYDLLVEQKPNAAIGAFLSGRIRLAGDLERLAGQTGFDR